MTGDGRPPAITDPPPPEAGDAPKRDLASLRHIAEIVSRFDVVALQEVRDDIKSLRHLMRLLGDDWCCPTSGPSTWPTTSSPASSPAPPTP